MCYDACDYDCVVHDIYDLKVNMIDWELAVNSCCYDLND
ncbi:hypothetical protein RG47T_1802 [Mucilaginibacter polytrichastri]|uniref:Uncharacterized protein n=1 Tax=Mucilaginibacter polytrichastri TaxID=1302689 RepID=A0A1Q5ZX96_9SPHI|nr:hypothetical protein RG47T_1802 [Mucilaginibacter polytrichastri]